MATFDNLLSKAVYFIRERKGGSAMSNVPNDSGKGMAIAAMICGILGIVGVWIPIVQYFTFVLSILGFILGLVARRRTVTGKGMATAGLVLGIISIACYAIVFLCTVACVGAFGAAGTLGAAGTSLGNALY